MKMGKVLAILATVVLTMLPETGIAQARTGLKICNQGNSTHVVAMVVRYPVLFETRWEASGWYNIAPGRCEHWAYGGVSTLFLLSVSEQTASGRQVLDYGVDRIPRTHTKSGSYGMEAFFCASDKAYRRTGSVQAEFENCRRDEYLQLFNVQVFVEHSTLYTLHIGG